MIMNSKKRNLKEETKQIILNLDHIVKYCYDNKFQFDTPKLIAQSFTVDNAWVLGSIENLPIRLKRFKLNQLDNFKDPEYSKFFKKVLNYLQVEVKDLITPTPSEELDSKTMNLILLFDKRIRYDYEHHEILNKERIKIIVGSFLFGALSKINEIKDFPSRLYVFDFNLIESLKNDKEYSKIFKRSFKILQDRIDEIWLEDPITYVKPKKEMTIQSIFQGLEYTSNCDSSYDNVPSAYALSKYLNLKK